jgi:hypothetical protein
MPLTHSEMHLTQSRRYVVSKVSVSNYPDENKRQEITAFGLFDVSIDLHSKEGAPDSARAFASQSSTLPDTLGNLITATGDALAVSHANEGCASAFGQSYLEASFTVPAVHRYTATLRTSGSETYAYIYLLDITTNRGVFYTDSIDNNDTDIRFEGTFQPDHVYLLIADGYAGAGECAPFSHGADCSWSLRLETHSVQVSVSGILTLEDCINPVQPVTFEFRPEDQSGIFQRTITLGADGSFLIPNIPPKSYSVRIKGVKWLAQTLAVNASNGDVENVTAFLPAGDANDDNSVDVLDLDLLIQAFDTFPGDPAWNENADFNCDERVDVLDLDILLRNFDIQGDP